MRLIKFPSIEQYRNVIRNVKHKAQFVGLDENGEPIVNTRAKLPTLDFEGTVKLHGTNAGVGIDPRCNMRVQSRTNIITPEKDNAGFAMFVHNNKNIFIDIVGESVDLRTGTLDKDVIVFGEWCGGSIQKGVAICQLPKMFVVFNISLVDSEGNKDYLSRNEIEYVTRGCDDGLVKSIYSFPTWTMKIDFDNPALYQNELNTITEGVETECPVGKSLGVTGVGEGVVWRCVTLGYEDSGFWFKVKGEKHSQSKVRTLAKVDVEKLNSIKELADKVANNERLEQAHQVVFDTLNGGETDIKKMGDFIKAVMADIFKEEMDTVSASGFTGKELSQPVYKICRDFIMRRLN